MRVDPTPCFILHNRPYRETSLLIDVFSLSEGRISLIVRGARTDNKKSAKQSLLQPYQKVLIGWYGKGDLGTATTIETTGTNYKLNGRRLISGFYVNELVLRLLHRHEPHAELFQHYENALFRLAGLEDEQKALRIFEKKILESVGFGLVLDHEIRTMEKIEHGEVYEYHLESGPALQVNGKRDENAVQIHGSTLTSLQQEDLSDPVTLKEARTLMRKIISSVIGTKPLASRELYQSYLKFQ